MDGPKDWPEKQRPYSCCHKIDRAGAEPPEDFHCKQAEPGDDILYVPGCYEMLKEKAKSAASVLIGVGIGIAFVEVTTNYLSKPSSRWNTRDSSLLRIVVT